MKRKIYAILLPLLLAGLTACSKEEKALAETPKPAAADKQRTTVNFTFRTLEGVDKKLSDYRGQVVIVDLWDTWCPPCRMEIPHFIELQNQYGERGFSMLGVAFGREGIDTVKNFVRDNRINYTNALMTQEIMSQFGDITGIPTTFVIDREGAVYKKYVGYREKSVFENDIKALLAR